VVHAHSEFFSFGKGGGGAEDVHNSCFILKILLQKLYCTRNIAGNCFYTVYIQIHVPRPKSPNLNHKA
jgi:hypothetical protein